MAAVLTPAQLARRADLYHQLSQMTAAGLTLPKALETIERNSRSFRQALKSILHHLEEGSTFSGAIARIPAWMPQFDAALLGAGERSGRLPACFKLLADYYQERAAVMRQVLQDLGYPLLLFHFAIFVLPFSQLFISGNIQAYLLRTVGILIPIYVVVFLLILSLQGNRNESWRALVEQFTRVIPLYGQARKSMALARLTAALEALLNAGVPIIEAWELAAEASGSPAIKQAVLGWRSRLESGQTPADVLDQTRVFPELFTNLYTTGEISGKLDESLVRMHALYSEEGTRKLRAFALWTPKLVYLGVAFMIAYQVVSFYIAYYGQVSDVMKGF